MHFIEYARQDGSRDLFLQKGKNKRRIGWMYKREADNLWVVGTAATMSTAKEEEVAVRMFKRIASCYE